MSAGVPELMFAQLLWIGCTLQIVQAACTEASNGAEESTKCKTSMCNVLIGGTGDENKYCSQCSLGTDHLIDGACVTTGTQDAATKCTSPTQGKCGSCGDGYFMYKGGCYNSKGAPGQAICTNAPAGVCDTPVSGYFVVPGAAKTDQSVAACGDATTGVTIGGNKKYVGVDGCSKCAAPSEIGGASGEATATCEACTAPKIVKTAKDKTTTCVTDDECTKAEGFFVKGSSTKTCEACGDENCATCAAEGTGKCSKCKATNTAGAKLYLKTVSSGSTGTCVEASGCGSGFFPKADDKAGNKCTACGSASDGGVDNCSECSLLTPASRSSTPLVTCTKCSGSNYLKTVDGATTCVAKGDCKDDFFPKEDNSNGNKCVSCGDTDAGVPNCAKCTLSSGVTKPTCSECGSGFKLEGEACVPAGTNLSTGAIAGISVAAVVVVGGLVGFLCWWFICRGKA